MLSRLHGHVEREESRWSQHASDLQRQLDEAHRQLNDRIIRQSNRRNNNRQKNHDDSEDEDYKEDSKVLTETVVK
jgi:hypothetical protein